jgi:2'-hydroxyisoflavone reductase
VNLTGFADLQIDAAVGSGTGEPPNSIFMDILFIGGTKFVGRHAAEAALRHGHGVTLLHRGTAVSDPVEGVEEVLLDRESDLSPVASRTWDAVVDTCGYAPRVVRNSVEALMHATGRYLFVSTISVYEGDGKGVLSIPMKPKVETEEITGETYGPLKFECEQVIREVLGDRAVIVRPGLVAGPYDPTNRFTYWVERMASGDRVLVPALQSQPMQLIDARDLGEFMISALEQGLSGDFDAAGEPSTFGQMIATCHSLNPSTEIVWATEPELEAQDVKLWSDLPLTYSADADLDALMRVPCNEALAHGLTRRSLLETAKDTLEWARRNRVENPPFGMSHDREREVLEAVVESGRHS